MPSLLQATGRKHVNPVNCILSTSNVVFSQTKGKVLGWSSRSAEYSERLATCLLAVLFEGDRQQGSVLGQPPSPFHLLVGTFPSPCHKLTRVNHERCHRKMDYFLIPPRCCSRIIGSKIKLIYLFVSLTPNAERWSRSCCENHVHATNPISKAKQQVVKRTAQVHQETCNV